MHRMLDRSINLACLEKKSVRQTEYSVDPLLREKEPFDMYPIELDIDESNDPVEALVDLRTVLGRNR